MNQFNLTPLCDLATKYLREAREEAAQWAESNRLALSLLVGAGIDVG